MKPKMTALIINGLCRFGFRGQKHEIWFGGILSPAGEGQGEGERHPAVTRGSFRGPRRPDGDGTRGSRVQGGEFVREEVTPALTQPSPAQERESVRLRVCSAEGGRPAWGFAANDPTAVKPRESLR